jgi:hypothetical protein
MIKVLARDSDNQAQTIVFWNCIRATALVVGQTYILSVLSTACLKVPKAAKPATGAAGSPARHFACYGPLSVHFSAVSDFILAKATDGESIKEVAAHEATVSVADALAAPRGSKALLLDVSGIVLSCFGRRDKEGKPFSELVLTGGGKRMRVSALYAFPLLLCASCVHQVRGGRSRRLYCGKLMHSLLS